MTAKVRTTGGHCLWTCSTVIVAVVAWVKCEAAKILFVLVSASITRPGEGTEMVDLLVVLCFLLFQLGGSGWKRRAKKLVLSNAKGLTGVRPPNVLANPSKIGIFGQNPPKIKLLPSAKRWCTRGGGVLVEAISARQKSNRKALVVNADFSVYLLPPPV